jgi:hypothetical protein
MISLRYNQILNEFCIKIDLVNLSVDPCLRVFFVLF